MTLVEILVALLIMAILSLLIFSTIGRINAAGEEARCLNNLRQIVLANLQYAAENNGQFPDGGTDQFAENRARHAANVQLVPYLPPRSAAEGRKSIWVCPSQKRQLVSYYYPYNKMIGARLAAISNRAATPFWHDRGLDPTSQDKCNLPLSPGPHRNGYYSSFTDGRIDFVAEAAMLMEMMP